MKYSIGDKFVIGLIECKVALIDARGYAYLVPEADGDKFDGKLVYKGLVYAVIDPKGYDKDGNRAVSIVNQECAAV